MRTTLTLDDDLSIALKNRCQESGASFKAVVNEVVRAGLVALGRKTSERRPMAMRTYRLGTPRLDSLDNIAEALAYAEGEDYP